LSREYVILLCQGFKNILKTVYADECRKQPSTSINSKTTKTNNQTNAHTNNEWTFLALDILCSQSFNFLDSCMWFWFNIHPIFELSWLLVMYGFSFEFSFHLFHHHLTSFCQFEIICGKYFLILYLFLKNRVKGKPRYSRSILVRGIWKLKVYVFIYFIPLFPTIWIDCSDCKEGKTNYIQ
jgi:hypothetical protein